MPQADACPSTPQSRYEAALADLDAGAELQRELARKACADIVDFYEWCILQNRVPSLYGKAPIRAFFEAGRRVTQRGAV